MIFLAFNLIAAFSSVVILVAPADTLLVTLLADSSFNFANAPFVALSTGITFSSTGGVSTVTVSSLLSIAVASSVIFSAGRSILRLVAIVNGSTLSGTV